MSFIESAIELAPKWLKRRWGRRWHAAIHAVTDAFADAALAAVSARFTTLAPSDALSLHGEARKIARAPGESEATYRVRLQNVFPACLEGGSSYGLEQRLREAGFTTATVLEAQDLSVPGPGSWARFWVVLEAPNAFALPSELWDDPGLWDDAGIWEDLEPADTLEFLRRLVRRWRAPHARCVALIVLFAGELWDFPGGTWDEPGGTWDAPAVVLPI